MAATLSQDQQYAVPGIVPIKFATLAAGPPATNYVRVWCTDAPDGSKLRIRLDSNTYLSRVEVFAGGSTSIWKADLDVGGKYTFVIQEYVLGASTYGGGYERGTDSWPTETKNGAEATDYIYIGDRITHRLGSPDYGYATFVMWVWEDTIQKTTAQVHGETSPAIISPTTDKAEAAAYNATVLATVDTFVGSTVASLLTNIATLMAEMVLDIPKHFNNNGGQYHNTAGANPDTTNDTEIEDLPDNPSTPAGYITAANVLARRLRQHMSDKELDWHDEVDFTNAMITPIPTDANDMPSVWAAIADVYRAYVAHIANTTSHNIADGTNTIATSLDKLLTLHRDFLSAMQALAPTAPTVANSGTTRAFQLGFVRSADRKTARVNQFQYKPGR